MFGLDLEACIARGWFDEVYVDGGWKDSAFWPRIARSGMTRVLPSGANWQPGHDQQALAKFTQSHIVGTYQGAFFWDIETHADNSYNWHALRKLCDPRSVADFASGVRKPPTLRTITRHNGVKCGRYHPTRSYQSALNPLVASLRPLAASRTQRFDSPDPRSRKRQMPNATLGWDPL